MSGTAFPDLALVELARKRDDAAPGDGRPSTRPLDAAAEKLAGVRDYLFQAEEPTSPDNMTQLRAFLERIDGYIITVTSFYDAAAPAAGQGIRESGESVRKAIATARICVRVMKQGAEDWEMVRTDLDRPPDNRRAHYRTLLDSQQEVEDSIAALAGRLRMFVQNVTDIGGGGSGSGSDGRPQRGRSRGRVMDGRPHYIAWQPRIVEGDG